MNLKKMLPLRKFLIGAVIILSVSQFNLAQAGVTTSLIAEGARLLAPFTELGLTRLQSTLFGSGRAARSTDVIIFNASSKTFKLKYTKCTQGGFSTEMFPERVLPSHQSTVFGIESNGFMTGVSCKAEYRSSEGSRFIVDVKNPYWSKNKVSQENSRDLHIVHTRGQGFNNNVRFIVDDADK